MTQQAEKSFKVEIYSDVVCPWCYVGKRNIQRALEYYRQTYTKEIQPEVHWMPFRLHASLPKEGVDRTTYLKKRYPGRANDPDLFADVVKAGRRLGLEYNFERIEVQPNTTDAHRLMRFAERNGVREAAVESLFRSYFTDGRNLSDPAVLLEIGTSVGLDAVELEAYLSSEVDVEWVEQMDTRAKRGLGITTVPFLVLNGRKGVSGVSPADQLFQALLWARKDYARPNWMPRFFKTL